MATNTDSTDSTLVRSRIEHGRYTNSFNPEFKMPDAKTIFRWVTGAPNNTNLPTNPRELDNILPVHKHERSQVRKTSSGVRFIWIGHATCLVQINDFMFITDPVFSERCGITPLIGPKRYRPPALDVNDLPDELNAVMISHNHFDHLDTPSVRRLNERYGKQLTWFCGLGGGRWFRDTNIENVVELDWWQEWSFPNKKNIQVAFCPAQHWSRRTPFDLNKSLWGGYAVQCGEYKFYFAGDTGYTHDIKIFKQIGQKYGPFDLSAIPIGAYEPRWMMEAQHVSPKEAIDIHNDIRSNKSIGIHWGTWALANEYYLEPKTTLQKLTEDQSLTDKFITIEHGQIFDLPENN